MTESFFKAAKRAAFSLGFATLWSARVVAQATPADTVIADSRLFHQSDLYVLAGFAVATAAMFPLDRKLATEVRREDLVTNKNLKRISGTFRFFGGPGPYIIGGSMYLAGRATRNRRLTELAVHGTEAVAVGLGTSFVLKVILGRGRPYTSADTNPRNFGLLRGFRSPDYQSFPSGHSTAAFSAAAAVTAETREWWPGSSWYIGPIMYGGATLVGISRMYEDKHWASDVAMGAAVGTFAGLKVVRFNHTHTGNRVDRFLIGDSKSAALLLGTQDGAHIYGLQFRF